MAQLSTIPPTSTFTDQNPPTPPTTPLALLRESHARLTYLRLLIDHGLLRQADAASRVVSVCDGGEPIPQSVWDYIAEEAARSKAPMPPKPLLVGELNPYGADPRYALYPLPQRSAGARLCHGVMGLSRGNYLRLFDRANLCVGKWSAPAATAEAERLIAERGPGAAYVLLGARVARTFGGTFDPFTVTHGPGSNTYIVLPHPSGLCRLWNEPGAFERARRVLVEAGVLSEAPSPGLMDAIAVDLAAKNAVDFAAVRRLVEYHRGDRAQVELTLALWAKTGYQP